MNLRSLNLNLLLVFDAVYTERSISKAAVALHLSQPTVSNALARLREQLDDPLFERDAQGMAPTARAKALVEPIRRALDILERGLQCEESFDYINSHRSFVIAVGDYGETVIVPRFVDWLGQVAPHIHIMIRPEPSALLTGELRDGTVDLALDYFTIRNQEYHSQCMLTDTLLSLARIDHPLIGDQLDLDTYLKSRHAVLLPRVGTQSLIDLALSKRGLQRRIAVTVPYFQSMPVMVQTSNLICTMPRRMANLYADYFQLHAYPVPLRTPRFPVYLIWHRSLDEDPGHRWLRMHMMEFAKNLA